MLSKYPHINKKMTMLFVFDGYENGMIRLFLYVYTNIIKYSHFLEIKQDILLKVSEVIKECGVEIAIPPQDVHISNNSQSQDIDISQYKKMKKNS